MRIQFKNTDRVKRLARLLSVPDGNSYNKTIEVVAKASGYKDFHELGVVCKATGEICAPAFASDIEKLADLVVVLSSTTNRNVGEVLRALSKSRFLGNARLGLREQLAVRTLLFENEFRPKTGKRQKGEVGRVKNLGLGQSVGILRSFGRPTTVITHKSANSGVADFEYVSPREKLPFFIPMRLYMPYGHWIERDGSWVLFSRDYFPLWRIRKGKPAERLDPCERIQFENQTHYWGEHRWPWSHPELYEEMLEYLEELGIRDLPQLVEVFKTLMDNDQIKDFKDAMKIQSLKPA